jgi:uncharacterized protein (DUF3084 family)
VTYLLFCAVVAFGIASIVGVLLLLEQRGRYARAVVQSAQLDDILQRLEAIKEQLQAAEDSDRLGEIIRIEGVMRHAVKVRRDAASDNLP